MSPLNVSDGEEHCRRQEQHVQRHEEMSDFPRQGEDCAWGIADRGGRQKAKPGGNQGMLGILF